MNLIDSAYAYFNPQKAVERARARYILEASKKRSFEGASRGTRRTKNWKTDGIGPNSQIGKDLYTLRNRARDLVKNSALAAGALETMVALTVGPGILPQSKNSFVNEEFDKWGNTTEIDADGIHTFASMQDLILKTVLESGECFVRIRRRRSSDKLTVPLQYQIIEPDFVDHLKNESLDNGERIIQGVHFDRIGKVKGYYLFEDHPGEYYLGAKNSYEAKFVKASEMLHVFKQLWPGQVRGVTWFHPVMMNIKDLSDVFDSELVRFKVSSLFAGFIYDSDHDYENEDDEEEDTLSEGINPGTMEMLPQGKDIRFSNPPVADGFREFVCEHLKMIASGLGLSYEALTGDLKQTSFSSGRMGHLQMYKKIDQYRYFILIPRLNQPICNEFLKALELKSGKEIKDGAFTHTPPKREFIDPIKETKAIKDAVRDGFISQPDGVRQYGNDPDEVINENKEFFEKADKAGLVFDTDPRKVSGAGNMNSNSKDGE